MMYPPIWQVGARAGLELFSIPVASRGLCYASDASFAEPARVGFVT